MFEQNKWHPWLLDQDSIWIGRAGREWAVTTIEGRYALNILKYIWRTHRTDVVNRPYFGRPLVVALAENVKRDLDLYGPEIIRLVLAEPDRPVVADWFEEFDDWPCGD